MCVGSMKDSLETARWFTAESRRQLVAEECFCEEREKTSLQEECTWESRHVCFLQILVLSLWKILGFK